MLGKLLRREIRRIVSGAPSTATAGQAEAPPVAADGTRKFNALAECRHGLMLFNVNDKYIGRALQVYGEYSRPRSSCSSSSSARATR